MSGTEPDPGPNVTDISVPADTGRARRRRRRIRWFTQESVGAAALLLSVSLAGISAWESFRGPDIVVAVPPDHLILYRDQGPRSAGLSLAIRVPLVNRAGSNYGDVVTGVTAELVRAGRPTPRFAYQSLVETYALTPAEGSRPCELRVRCVTNTSFLALERLQALVDLPGGASRDQQFGFVLDRSYCTGVAIECARYADFDSALAALYSSRVDVRIQLSFSSERRRGVTCTIQITPAQRDYLISRGWVTLPCQPPSPRSSPA